MSLKTLKFLQQQAKSDSSYEAHVEKIQQDEYETHLKKVEKGAIGDELSVGKLIELLQKCPQQKTLWTGSIFKSKRLQSVRIDQDGRVMLISANEDDKELWKNYGKEII